MAALGRRWTWKLWRATCRRASRPVPSPRTVGAQAAVFVNVLRQSNEDNRLHVIERRLTPELLDEIREFIDEECGRISVKIVPNRFTLSRSSSRRAIRMLRLRPLVVVPCPIWDIRDRRKFAEEMLARLALGSGRRTARKIS